MKFFLQLLILVTSLAQAQNVIVSNGSSITIEKNSSLTMTGSFFNNGTVTLNSDGNEFASVIVNGSASGNIIYNRYVNAAGAGEWDLIGSPVNDLPIGDFASRNSASLAVSGSQYGIGVYDNATDTWINFSTSTISEAGDFDIGKGYQMASRMGETLAFVGTIATSNQLQSIINNDAVNSGVGRRWNLVANPFPSYIYANDHAHPTDNFLTVNSDKLDDTYEAIYGYNADGSGYTVYNHAYHSDAPIYLAPGQGFMIASNNTNTDTVSFTEDMQTIIGGDDFIAGRNSNILGLEIILKLYHGTDEIEKTKLYFKEGLTLGLNPGYDAGSYSQNAAIMSRLTEEDQGHGLAINAMGLESMYTAMIPLVIHQEEGESFKVVLASYSVPDDVKVYLEDVQLGTMTYLNTTDFELIAENRLSEVGRFYIHLSEGTLSTEEVKTNSLNAFKPNYSEFITVEGLLQQDRVINVKLYNILGREVIRTYLNNNTNTQTISTKGLATGIYILKLVSGTNQLTKKLFIR